MTPGLRNVDTDVDADVDAHRSPRAKIGVGLGNSGAEKRKNQHAQPQMRDSESDSANSTDDSDQTTRLYPLIHSSLLATSLLSSWSAMSALKLYSCLQSKHLELTYFDRSTTPISNLNSTALSVTTLLCFSICKVNQSDCSYPIDMISFSRPLLVSCLSDIAVLLVPHQSPHQSPAGRFIEF
jgi:hypothetical protein